MTAYHELSDQELTSLLIEGNQIAFAEIYKRYWSVMYSHALKMLRDEEDARDTVQELFTTLWSKTPQIIAGFNLAGFLYITVKNKVIDLMAQKKVRTNYLESLALFLEEHPNDIIERITQKELMQALETEIEQLPAKMKVIFNMRVKENLSYKEIASQLDISDKTVKKQVSNAIKILNPKLKSIAGWSLFIYAALHS